MAERHVETRVLVVVGYGGGDNLDGRDFDARLRPVLKVGGHVLGGRGQRPCPCRFGVGDDSPSTRARWLAPLRFLPDVSGLSSAIGKRPPDRCQMHLPPHGFIVAFTQTGGIDVGVA